MEHFTQLNLQAKSHTQNQNKDKGPQTAHIHSQGKDSFSNKQKTAAVSVSLVVTALLGGFLLETSGCSRGNSNSAHNMIAPPTVTPARAIPAAAVAVPIVAGKTAPKKVRQHKLAASTYQNPSYGLTFRYPHNYSVLEGDKAQLEWKGLGPVEMNFAQPGGTTLSAVTLPKGSFPGSDFSAAFFNVSVNQRLSADECERFLFPQSKAGIETPAKLQPSRVKLGAAEFTEVEDSGGDPAMQADAKYYHVYQNGTCYEFMLGVETAANKITDTPVNRNEVFRKLNWMLSTVKIESAALPEKTVPEVAKGASSVPSAESKN
jgi:hypothetical protein